MHLTEIMLTGICQALVHVVPLSNQTNPHLIPKDFTAWAAIIQSNILMVLAQQMSKEVEKATKMAVKWNKQGVPPKVQADMAKRKSDNIFWYVASEMFKKAGMQLFMLSAWKNEEGKLLVSSHDYNDEFSNGESFSKTCNWQVILLKWESYVSKQFNKEVEGDTIVKKGRKDNTYTLEIEDDGLPILPDHTEMDSDIRKAII
ncbi:hypothetical protein DFH29DRAFT_1002841 [Suillus ampliporus]|nr:hypothetical protein DFH29DRAFT_1002841 [Suillus ampliporus]